MTSSTDQPTDAMRRALEHNRNVYRTARRDMDAARADRPRLIREARAAGLTIEQIMVALGAGRMTVYRALQAL